jgi:hypothetical protein
VQPLKGEAKRGESIDAAHYADCQDWPCSGSGQHPSMTTTPAFPLVPAVSHVCGALPSTSICGPRRHSSLDLQLCFAHVCVWGRVSDLESESNLR